MRKVAMGLAALTLLTAQAPAMGVEDHARIVLSGGSLLKKAEATCGAAGRLSKKDALALTYARAATEQALPISQFQALFQTSEAEASDAALATAFCSNTRKKRSAVMSEIRKAGKALVAAKAAG